MIVLDSSAVVALLVDNRGVGAWVSNQLRGEWLLAPDLLPAEVDNVLRRHLASSRISEESAGLAHSNMATMPIDLFSYRPFADRVWELRGSVSSYDAWYIALAESFDAGLITLNRRLATAPGPTCEFVLPPAA